MSDQKKKESEHVKHAKLAPQQWKDIVFGYLRRHETKSSRIPELVQNLCLDWYWLDEKFQIMQEQEGNPVTLSENGHLVKNQSLTKGEFEGNFDITILSDGVAEYKWMFEMRADDGIEVSDVDSTLEIGMMALIGDTITGKCIRFERGKAYYQVYDPEPLRTHCTNKKCAWKTGDVLTMRLIMDLQARCGCEGSGLLCFTISRCGTIIWNECIMEGVKPVRCCLYGRIGKGISIRLIDFSVLQE